MNFNYDKLYINNKALKREEKPKENKDSEAVKEEPPKTVINPKTEQVMANADEVIATYVQAAIRKAAFKEVIPEEPQAGSPNPERSVNDLILQWEDESENMDDAAKIDLLTQIIDGLESEDPNADTDIWRLKRYIIIHNKNMNELFLYEVGQLDYRPGRPYVPGDGYYDKYKGDTNVYLKYSRMYYHQGGIEDDELRTLFIEAELARNARWLEANLVDLKEDGDSPTQAHLALAKSTAIVTFSAFVRLAENTNPAWKEAFKPLKDLFIAFQNAINSGTATEDTINTLVNNIRTKIQDLSDHDGLSNLYCNILTYTIKSYLSYADLRSLWP